MSTVAWLLVGVLLILLILGVVLAIIVVRLGRELKQLGDDTESAIVKMRQAVRTVQVAVPVIALGRRAVDVIKDRWRKSKKRKAADER